MIIYNKCTGDIVMELPPSQQIGSFFCHYPEEFINSLSGLDAEIPASDRLDYYKVVDGGLARRTDLEIKEINNYGKILSEEERLNMLLQPTGEEVTKAESTLEILSTLQEVGLI